MNPPPMRSRERSPWSNSPDPPCNAPPSWRGASPCGRSSSTFAGGWSGSARGRRCGSICRRNKSAWCPRRPEVKRMADRLLKSLRSEKAFTVLLLIPILAVLFAYVLYPSFRTLAESLTAEGRFSLEHYRQFFSPETLTNLEALWNSLYISVLSVLLSGLVGVPLAFIFNRYDFPGRSFFAAAAVLPIVLPPLVGVMSFLMLYGESRLITRTLHSLLCLDEPRFRLGGVSCILLVHTYSLYVYFYMTVPAPKLRNNPALEEGATNL